MGVVDLSGLDRAQVLIALYNNSTIQGLGILDPRDASPLTLEQAQDFLKDSCSVGYVFGRSIKVDLSRSPLETHAYDRDNGKGKAAIVIENM